MAVAPEPAAKTPQQVAEETRFFDYARWQAGVRDEAMAVHKRLQQAEKGNYVDVRFESDSEPFTVVFAFLRNGPETLRKYTQRSDFVAETVRWSKEEQAAAGEALMAFLQRHKVRFEGGWGNKENRPIFRAGITEAEYKALAAKHGFTLPEPVLLTFVGQAATQLNQPLRPEVGKGIRLFARATQPVGPVESIWSLATVQLKDGCFRLKGDGAHVVFPLGYTLHRDAEGHLTFGAEREEGNARVGEEARFHGILKEVEEEALAGEVRAACGEGRVVRVNALKSAALAEQQHREEQRRWLR